MEKLWTLFRQLEPRLTTEQLEQMAAHWNKTLTLKKGDWVITPDRTEHFLYWVLDGTYRIYVLREDSEEICVGFGYPDTFLCSIPSFARQKPAPYYIQALSKGTLVGISKQQFDTLLQEIPLLERCWRLLLEEATLGLIAREVEMLTKTPAQRLQGLLERSPHIFQLIPQRYIASYLAIRPETLSRLKYSLKKS